jgi:regulation of enolase protein 1 (concanavalin A-like superfamily)
MHLPALPFALHASEGSAWTPTASGIEGTAPAGTDLFVDPSGVSGIAAETLLNAHTLLGTPPAGDFTLSARVTPDFRATFDAGVLLAWVDDTTWAKLCFERSPAGASMVVSVVTKGVSDDANGFVVSAPDARLRIARVGNLLAFHAHDGEGWSFVRAFTLPGVADALTVGFEVQSPTGEGCRVAFDEIVFERRTVADLRSGD